MISLDEFNNLPEEEKKNTLLTLKNEVGIKEILEAWGISRSKLYNMQNKLGISNETKKPKKPLDKKTRVVKSRSPRKPGPQVTFNADNGRESYPKESGFEQNINTSTPMFSLQLETTGPAAILVDTIQMILLSERVVNLNLKVNIQIEQI